MLSFMKYQKTVYSDYSVLMGCQVSMHDQSTDLSSIEGKTDQWAEIAGVDSDIAIYGILDTYIPAKFWFIY